MASAPTTPCHLLLQPHDPDPSRRATEMPSAPSRFPLLSLDLTPLSALSLSLSHDRAELVAADTVHRGHQPSPAQRLCSSAPPRRLHRPRRAMQPGAHRIAAIDVVFHPGRPRSPATPHRRLSSREPAEHARRPAVSSPLLPLLPRARFRTPAPHRNAPVAPAPAVVVVVVATDHPTARHVHDLKRLIVLVP